MYRYDIKRKPIFLLKAPPLQSQTSFLMNWNEHVEGMLYITRYFNISFMRYSKRQQLLKIC